MFKYLFLFFSLFVPVKISTLNNFKIPFLSSSHLVAIASPGGTSSKLHDNLEPLPEGCTVNTDTVTHNDGSTTEIVTITMTKKERRDKHGRVIKVTDTSRPDFQAVNDMFFNDPPPQRSEK